MQEEVLIVGGGVAGCAASIELARKGRAVTLIERETMPRHKVCGEFLSGEALEDLHALGIDVTSLGAVPIDYVRLAAARRAATAPLPFPAKSLTRKALDTALLASAVAAGVRVERGRSVRSLIRTSADRWQATLNDGTTYKAHSAFLATGKHDLRGHPRPKDPDHWVAFKMYYRLSAAQTTDLGAASELTLYAGGYGGIQPVEDGIANFCCVVQRRFFQRAGLRWESLLARMQQDCPHLAMRLDGAKPVLDRPITVTHIPYGYLRRTTEEAALLYWRPGCSHSVVHGRWHIHRSAYSPPCRCCLSCRGAGAGLSTETALGNAAPDASCGGGCVWLEQRARSCGVAVLPKSLARRDARDGAAHACYAAYCCYSTTGVCKLRSGRARTALDGRTV